jgi:hypothetical protein
LAIRDALVVINEMEAAGVIGRYAICGAIAAYVYIESANTADMDILISFGGSGNKSSSGLISLTPIIDYLARKGFDKFAKEGIVVADWAVQFLPVASALDEEALAEAETVEFGVPPVTARVLRPEHLVAASIRVGRPKDIGRIAQFLEEGEVDLARLRGVIVRHGLQSKWREFKARSGMNIPDSQ